MDAADLCRRLREPAPERGVAYEPLKQQGWDGCLSCAQWLSWRAGLSPGAAREHVRVARALGKLPKLSAAMRSGKISYSKVRAVTRVATPGNEDDLLDVCLGGTAEHVERITRAWRRIDRNVEQAEERRQQASRELRTWVDEDGMVIVRGRLTPEAGSVLRRALEAACDQARGAAADPAEPTLAQRQADAIGTLAEAALAGGLDRGSAGDRYQVVLHVDAEALAEPPDVPAGTPATARAAADGHGRVRQRRRRPSGPCPGARPTAPPYRQTVLDEAGGIHVSAETARRLACDAATVTMRPPQKGVNSRIINGLGGIDRPCSPWRTPQCGRDCSAP